MRTDQARTRVVPMELRRVEAKNDISALRKFAELQPDVIEDDTDAEAVDWESGAVAKIDG
jgi:hypothetical protein